MRRTDPIRMHSEEATAHSQAAETAVEPTRTWLLEGADDHQAMADAARLGDYYYDELED
ncbi:hypothetical protein [Streptomyces sp. YGL11-2]|uniref:hypothetical protein n=1 Tax=Streptomyces sp. YGL11-2 TaxID=3414028 RepID=UPI003CECAD41